MKCVHIEIPTEWDDLEMLNEATRKQVVTARAFAVDIIAHLDPAHISSMADLMAKLEESTRRIKVHMKAEKTFAHP